MRRVGIMSALEEEMHFFLKAHQDQFQKERIGNRDFYLLKWKTIELVIVFSRWGKVASASTTTILIAHFEVDEIIFSGVAGAIDAKLNIGDIVIGKRLIQHDMDPRPIFKRFEVPLTGKTYIESDPLISDKLKDTARQFLNANYKQRIDPAHIKLFGLDSPKVLVGDILTGDQFIHLPDQVQILKNAMESEALCVEMEGAAIAQVCLAFEKPFAIIRIISDKCDDQSKINFPLFTSSVSSIYMREIISDYLNLIAD